jgi:hypothetical protein
MADDQLEALTKQLADTRAAVVGHPVYGRLTDLPSVRVFMRHHVLAVLDFMALLKSLQRDLTCPGSAGWWYPVGDPATRRLVNEIVLAEESDALDDGTAASHFELYLAAMEQAGASTAAARRLAGQLAAGQPPGLALCTSGNPEAAVRFSMVTIGLLGLPLHARAAVFAFSRELVIPDMFAQAIDRLPHGELATFREYLARHIELDADEHGPAALAMVGQCCGDDPARWDQAADAALVALTARRELWDAVAALIP